MENQKTELNTQNLDDSNSNDNLISTEIEKCIDSIKYLERYKGKKEAGQLLEEINTYCLEHGIPFNASRNTPYLNTISVSDEPKYPGDRLIEQRIRSYIRWNAMAMVVKANRNDDGLGGHISTYASAATLQEVGMNHFFRAATADFSGDQIFFQGHSSPGPYARAFLEGRLSAEKLSNFRRELAPGGGLSSYPHPYLMPDFWQFPTVSMGLGPLMAIYQARFNRYLQNRNFLKGKESNVWCFVGDGEIDEPETLAGINLASRESLDNLTFVVNCNLQRLDGPVRGNGKVIQELEGIFRGAGWNVIKVVWGSDWDELLKADTTGLLKKRMEECLDGEFQKYTVEPGSYARKHFFGKYPELYNLVNHLTDADISKLQRGGHDPQKVYSAYHAAVNHKGAPTVILAKTVKGYGLGEAGEGKNISHQQKKLNEKELREFKVRFKIPISDDEVVNMPFYKPEQDSVEMKYLLQKRKDLGGFLPKRTVRADKMQIPELDQFKEFFKGSGKSKISTTMGFVRVLSKLIKNKDIGKNIVPIVPDEARTFGMEALFRQIGIYSPKGQLYEPADNKSLLFYKESKDGQILEEGINEAGAMSSFLTAGTSYATHGVPMIPFYTYYSMFGFQRVGDQMWLAGDIRAKGFLLGGTAGRTTLNGEGLQHQDGHSHLIASTIPNCITYDPAFRYEIAVIIQDGLRRMYGEGEEIFYYITIGNENYVMPEMPKGCEKGILKGLYKFKPSKSKSKIKAHVFGSGSIINEALKAQTILEENYGVSVDVWSATNYKQLRTDALNAQRWNLLNPDKKKKTSYVEDILKKEKGVFVAVSDNVKLIPDQILPWVPGGLTTLGTDGFGRSETREKLRRFFEVDAEITVLATLTTLVEKGELSKDILKKAIKDLNIDADKAFPILV
ncbi:pyruvate dehydrogenase (acetyl-transferring), homodimeric type [bacterium]|jgi:pyruvate dehydrogenase E1 component|nr:pyruvate dehydrogenase (acetyl-transferring), homodimeric type [bacterium]